MISMFLVVKECFIPHPRLPDLIGIQKQVLMLGYCILRTFHALYEYFFLQNNITIITMQDNILIIKCLRVTIKAFSIVT